MKQNQKGFSLVELMITMAIFLIVIVAAGNIFSALLGQFKQQSSVAESNIEGIIGLEILRRDIEQAGYGLPWDLNGAAYSEAGQVATPYTTPWAVRDLNDGPPVAGTHPARPGDIAGNSNPPGAMRIGNAYNSAMPSGCSTNPANTNTQCSDVLVLKGVNIGTNDTVQKSTYILNTGGSNYIFRSPSGAAANDLQNNDRVIVIRAARGTSQRILQIDTSAPPKFYANFRANTTTGVPDMAAFTGDTTVAQNADFLPAADSNMYHVFYGIAPSTVTTPRRPFNRADYYIKPTTNMPARCAPGSGVLYKAILTQNSGDATTGATSTEELPLLDCVADMQIVFGRDINGDGASDIYSDDVILTLSAAEIRNQLKEVRVYILAHEGKLDMTYTYTNSNPVAGCTAANQVCINDVGGVGLIKAFTVPSLNYRWKIYTLSVTPYSLR